MVLVEDGTRAEFEIIGCEHSDAVAWEFGGESCAAVVVFEGCNAGCDYDTSACYLH